LWEEFLSRPHHRDTIGENKVAIVHELLVLRVVLGNSLGRLAECGCYEVEALDSELGEVL